MGITHSSLAKARTIWVLIVPSILAILGRPRKGCDSTGPLWLYMASGIRRRDKLSENKSQDCFITVNHDYLIRVQVLLMLGVDGEVMV